MTTTTPRIDNVKTIAGFFKILVRFTGEDADRTVDLSGFVAMSGEALAPLRDGGIFSEARVSDFNDAIVWGDEDGDLAIDAVHLDLISRQQAPITAEELSAWQDHAGISNAEASNILGVSRSTFLSYKSGANIPQVVAIAVRASMRDPIIVESLLRPSVPGRPKSPAELLTEGLEDLAEALVKSKSAKPSPFFMKWRPVRKITSTPEIEEKRDRLGYSRRPKASD